MLYCLQICTSIILDALIGDPTWYPHPVRIIGKVIDFAENITRAFLQNLYIAGLATVFFVLIATGLSVYLILLVSSQITPVLADILAVVFIYMAIAARDLLRHSLAVAKQLEEDSLELARQEVAKIVGRDTAFLNEDGICRACIETVAENMVDGITAPLFWAVLASLFAPFVPLSPIGCSAVGIFLYKVVNTMDSMIAYKNEKYMEFGRVAAKLDDAVNFIPARISGFCVILAAILLNLDYRNAARIFFRDRNNHVSPNAGHTEAAVAGALNIRLGGPLQYFNKVVDKAYLGDDLRPPLIDDIKTTNMLSIVGSLIFLMLILSLKYFV